MVWRRDGDRAARCTSLLVVMIGCLGWLAIAAPALAQTQPAPPSGAAPTQPVPQAELEELKARVQKLQELVEKGQREQKEAKPPEPTFRQKIRIFGDTGYRAEMRVNNNFLTGEDEYRNRYRLRINGYYQVNEYWETGFRVVNADPRYPSTAWETFGQSPSPNEFSGPESGSGRSGFVNFDRAFINWTPTSWFRFQLGKQEIPVWKPWMVWGSSVWIDDDVQPAGTFEVFTLPAFGASKSMRLVFGQVYLDEYISGRTDFQAFQVRPTRGATLWVQQISGVLAAAQDLDVSWGLGYYVFDNIGNFARGVPQAMTAGTFRNRSTNIARAVNGSLNCSPFASALNTLPACDRYLSEYQLGNASIEFFWKWRYPVRVAADVVYNFGAAEYLPGSGKQGLAWLTHFSVGSFRQAGEMQFGAGYYWGQADATWAVYADDDYLNTNVNTFMFNWKWKIFKDVLLVWDNYIRRLNNSQLAVLQGLVPNATAGNATFSASRLTVVVSF